VAYSRNTGGGPYKSNNRNTLQASDVAFVSKEVPQVTLSVNPYMFRAYDIRGVVQQDLTADTAELIGMGIGTYLQSIKCQNLAVGRDNRLSSESLTEALIKGLLSTGCDVTDIGLSSSPLLYFTVCDQEFDGGVNVTGSHNPPEYNGFKIVSQNAYPVAAEDIAKIKDLVLNRQFKTGSGTRSHYDPSPQYFDRLERLVQVKRRLRVVVDTGNGVCGLFAPEVLQRIGCDVIELHCELDGNFPNHLPNPENEANVEDVKQKVVETGADIGIAFDGDGDRLGIIDEKGKFYEADYMTIMLARDYLARNPGAKVIIDVKASQNVINEIQKWGGTPVMWNTGHSLIKQKMWKDKISLAGEFSGHMFVAENYYIIDDALFAACHVLRILADGSIPLSNHFTDLPKLYSTRLIELPCPDSDKFDVVKALGKKFAAEHEVYDIDGARVDFGGGWALVRASNTTPVLTLRFEAETQQRLEEIKSTVYQALKQFPSVKL
jgi:phosphomannomutase/phosphoglucomutase